MHRFFVEKEKISNDMILIDGEDVQHISKVLRLKESDEIMLCDGAGMDYLSSIVSIDKHHVKVRILTKLPSKAEPEIQVVLYQGLPKSTKMDLIIQKCTEMGISKIVPMATYRAVVKLETEKDERKKVERWTKIAEEAAKQSGRGIVPKIEMPLSFKEAVLDSQKLDLSVIPYEQEKNNFLNVVLKDKKIKQIGYFVGPEGGFEASEIDYALSAGIVPVTLGPRILRTETAGFAVLTCIMYEYGQMQ